jgi:hypothetical protein
MAARGEKLGGAHESISRWAEDVVDSPFFSGAVGSIQLHWVSMKGCHVWLVVSVYVSYVLGFSCGMYINSNRRDSGI